jgi:hypothetical protein
MSYTIGRITVPTPPSSGLTWPVNLSTDFGYTAQRPFPTITHRFNEYALKANQTFAVGIGPRKFSFKRKLSIANEEQVKNFFESMQGAYQTFTYNVPQANSATTTSYTVVFENQPLTFNQLVTACEVGFNMIEVPTSNPSYSITETDTRFPGTSLTAALLDQTQTIIPLISITCRDTTVPVINLSDRACVIGGTQYVPRVLSIGEPGSGVIMSQSLSSDGSGSGSDNIQFQLANGDRVMTQVMNNSDLMWATVTLSFFHVNTGVLLNLWQGYITDCTSDGTAVFHVQCADGLWPLMQQYPIRTVNRSCWKLYNDGINCPFSSAGLLNTTVFPSASSSTCDRTFDGANGCQAHGMDLYFGGMPLNQQSVIIKDEGTGGWFGIGKQTVTSTSIINDTVVGDPLPEIWCNNGGDPIKSFIAPGLMFSARDESSFIDCAAIIGSGPIQYTITGDSSGILVNNAETDNLPYVVAPTLDNFYPQGFKLASSGTSVNSNSNLGLRQVVGNDPIDADNQGYEQFGLYDSDQPLPAGWPSGTATSRYMTFSAGTAFVEIRVPQPVAKGGLIPTAPSAHSISVPIAQGLTGWTFDADGNRTAVTGLVNPAWICLNTYFRALGIQNADAATQLETFVLSSFYKGDGSGAAEICDLVVPVILGTGTETQFMFQGSIGGVQKPCRDWLQQILNCCLGWYCFENGKLKVGIRENASSVSAFTLGNMLYQSLTTKPVQAKFEAILLNYADVDYAFQQNTASYEDYDHETYYNRPGAPLRAPMNSAGISTISQALRCIATRVREECGGVAYQPGDTGYEGSGGPDYHEYLNARVASWKSTILALDCEVGQVVSITHPDIPTTMYGTNTANFRITGWKLMQDWSIQFTGRTVIDSMYDLDYGPKPIDVTPSPLPVLLYPQPLGQWMPWGIQAPSTDALFPNEYSFQVAEQYTLNADGTQSASMVAEGLQPVNNYIPLCPAPDLLPSDISFSSTGGSIPGGITLKMCVYALNTPGQCSPPSNVIVVQVPSGTNTNTITINNIQWPNVANLAYYVVAASIYDDLMAGQPIAALTASTTTGVPYTPTSITMTTLHTRTFGVPNSNVAKVVLRGKLGLNFGVAGFEIDSVGTNTIVSSSAISATDNWVGRTVTCIGRPESIIPFNAYEVTAFDKTTGTFTLDISGTNPFQAGDIAVICFKGYDNSSTPYYFTDAGIDNSINQAEGFPSGWPTTAGTTGCPTGMLFRVWAGTGRGMTAHIVSNTSDTLELDVPITLDSTSIIITEFPSWVFESNATAISNSNLFNTTSLTINTTNMVHQPLLLAGFIIDVNGVESPDDGEQPMRMAWVSGQEGTVFATTPFDGWQAALNALPQDSYPS